MHSAAELDAQAAFRSCVGCFPTGVCVVTAEHEGKSAGMTLNSFTSVSLEPLLVLVALAHGARTLEAVRGSGRFGISVLRRGQRDIALDFSIRGAAFPTHRVETTADGFLLVRNALASLRCEVESLVPTGDHDIAIGRVLSFAGESGEPLVFHAGRFGHVSADAAAPESFTAFLDWGIG